MTYIDTLLVDGHDVRTLPGVIACDYIDGLYAPGIRRGDDDVVPGRRGVLGNELMLDKYLISVPLTVHGATTAALNTNLATIGSYLQGTNGLVTLTRHLDNGAGYDSYTAPGRVVSGFAPTLINWTTGQATFQFYNLAGAWNNGTVYVFP